MVEATRVDMVAAAAEADTQRRAATVHHDHDRRSPTNRQSNRTPARRAAESTVSSELTPVTFLTIRKSTTSSRPRAATVPRDQSSSTNRKPDHNSTNSRSTSSSSRATTVATTAATMAPNRMDQERPSSTRCELQPTRSPLVTTRWLVTAGR